MASGGRSTSSSRSPRFRQRFLVRHAVIDRALGDGLADRDARIERAVGVLENDLDALAVRLQQPPRQLGDFAAGKPDAAGGRIDQPDDAARHRRFAGAAFADDAERAALAQRQCDILGGRHFAHRAEEGALAIDLAELRSPPAPPARWIRRAAPAGSGSAPPRAGCGCIPWSACAGWCRACRSRPVFPDA